MIDFRALETFYWVAELGSFHRTAEKLHTTQPAISARIAQLEDELATKLIVRSRPRVGLTPKGIEVLGYAKRLLALRRELMTVLGEKGRVRGVLRLGVSETIVHTWLSELLRRLHREYPLVSPEVVVDISPNLRDSLLRGELDLAFLLGPISAPRVQNIRLCEYPLAWVASPELTIPRRKLSLSEVVRWPIITYARGTRPHAELVERLDRARCGQARIFANSSLASIVRMTLDGVGLGVLPVAAVRSWLDRGDLRRVSVGVRLPSLVFCAAYLDQLDFLLPSIVAEMAKQVAAMEDR
jgi:DNA-binding transcriptional LysR family regulator